MRVLSLLSSYYQKFQNDYIPNQYRVGKIFSVFSVLFLAVLLSGGVSQTAMAAKKTTIQVENNGKIKKYSNTGQKVTLDGTTISTKSLPSVKINNVWMVSVTEVFENGLGCMYSYDSVSQKITLGNPETDCTAILTVGSKKAIIDNTSYSLPYQVIEATNPASGKTGFLVPVSYLSKKLGYTCSYNASDKNIKLTTITFLDKDVKIPEYDSSIYTNVLTAVNLRQNAASTRQVFELITKSVLSTENVKIVEDEEKGLITYTLLNTYNAVGNIQKTYQTSFVKKLSIVTSGHNIIITVTYKSKYSYMTQWEEDSLTASFSSATYSLKIKMPEGVKFSQIKNQDQYYKKRFLIEIPGKWEEYYESNPIISNNNVIQSVQVDAKASGTTQILVKTKKLQGYKLTEKNGYFTVIIDDPKKIYKNIVVLDAGHGGKDDGATNKGTKEKNLNYKIIYSKAKEYFDSSDSNVKAYWTRTDDTFITLADRAKFASKVGADLFVSLHMNSCNKSSVNGLEVYYSKENNKATYSGLTSRILANKMLNTLKTDLNSSSRGVKTARFYVTKNNTVPAILVELGFLSGNSDYRKLTSDSYQTQAAESIYNCISSIFQTYPTKR